LCPASDPDRGVAGQRSRNRSIRFSRSRCWAASASAPLDGAGRGSSGADRLPRGSRSTVFRFGGVFVGIFPPRWATAVTAPSMAASQRFHAVAPLRPAGLASPTSPKGSALRRPLGGCQRLWPRFARRGPLAVQQNSGAAADIVTSTNRARRHARLVNDRIVSGIVEIGAPDPTGHT
jgi:hypothetical protein